MNKFYSSRFIPFPDTLHKKHAVLGENGIHLVKIDMQIILEKNIPFLIYFFTSPDFQGRFRLSETKYTKALSLEIYFFPLITDRKGR